MDEASQPDFDPKTSLNELETSYLNCYYAFLFFEPGEQVSVKDLQVFWGCTHAKRLDIIQHFEMKSLVTAEAQEMTTKQNHDLFISIEPACYEAAFERACLEILEGDDRISFPPLSRRSVWGRSLRPLSLSLTTPFDLERAVRLEQIRMKMLMGESRFYQNERFSRQLSSIGCIIGLDMVLFEAVLNGRRKLIRQTIRKITPDNLLKLCREHSRRPDDKGKAFLHFLYRSTWPDDVKYPPGHPHEALGVNNSYRLIRDILRRTRSCPSRDISAMISEPGSESGLRSFLTAVLDDMDEVSQSSERAPLVAALYRWRNLYEERNWQIGLVKDPRTSPSLFALLNGNLAKLKDVDYLNNPSNDLSYAACLAARCGHLDIVMWFYKNVPDPTKTLQRKDGITPLWMAAKNGHFEVVKWLCKHAKETASQAQTDGTTALCVAAQNGHFDVVKVLSDVALKTAWEADSDGTTPMWLAAQNGHLEIVEFLCRVAEETAGQARKNDGTTPLWIAAQHGHLEVVMLLSKVAKNTASKPQNDGATPLWIAAQNGELEVVRFLGQIAKETISTPENDGTSPLWIAAQNGHLHVVEFLSQNAIKTASLPNKTGATPLLIAAANGHLDVVSFLSEQARETVTMPDSNGATPLCVAAEFGHLEIVALLSRIAPSTASDRQSNGATPLWLASQNGHFEVVKYLGNVAPDTAYQTEDTGTTPAWIAAQNGHVEVVKLLNKIAKDSLGQGNRVGSTPLWIAAATNQVEMVRLLCEIAITTVSLPNNDGMSPLWIAAGNGHLEVVKLLAEKIDHTIPMPCMFGLSPAQVARSRGYNEIADMLALLEQASKKETGCYVQ